LRLSPLRNGRAVGMAPPGPCSSPRRSNAHGCHGLCHRDGNLSSYVKHLISSLWNEWSQTRHHLVQKLSGAAHPAYGTPFDNSASSLNLSRYSAFRARFPWRFNSGPVPGHRLGQRNHDRPEAGKCLSPAHDDPFGKDLFASPRSTPLSHRGCRAVPQGTIQFTEGIFSSLYSSSTPIQ